MYIYYPQVLLNQSFHFKNYYIILRKQKYKLGCGPKFMSTSKSPDAYSSQILFSLFRYTRKIHSKLSQALGLLERGRFHLATES